jgi:hypothetical protein
MTLPRGYDSSYSFEEEPIVATVTLIVDAFSASDITLELKEKNVDDNTISDLIVTAEGNVGTSLYSTVPLIFAKVNDTM